VIISNSYGQIASRGASLSLLPAGQQVITFDDLPSSYDGLRIANGYVGLNWSNFYEIDGLVGQLF